MFALLSIPFCLVGCGGSGSTVVETPADQEPQDVSAEAAEQYPEEYAKMNQAQ
ncbi:secreted protein [Rhodopirellula maiorica SM1]|uniref:Secreted protein n=2 Tax=Novipirellula TaxID=2795426 RepID=M5RWF6_9BACT|nr:secreted protein [Rhodopirellula maiorica SM1]